MITLRVLHVVESMIQGGAESLILEHLRHAAHGSQSTVCALNRGGRALDAARAMGADAVLLGKGARRAEAIRRIAALIRERGVNVVNAHNPTGALYGTLAGTLASVPAIVRTEHSVHYPDRHSRVYGTLLEPLLTLGTGAVVCVCEAVRASHAARHPWAARRFVTVENGISEGPLPRPRDRVRAELGVADEARVVLTVGSLTPQKAQHVLVEAFAELARAIPLVRLLIAGGGEREPGLRAQVEGLGLSGRVSFLGPRADVRDLLEASDVFALSSAREGLPVTLLEAMRASRPSVVTRVGGCAEAVEHGLGGLVSPAGDAPALARALEELLRDPERAATMGRSARGRWEQRYRAERMVRETEAVYLRLLERQAGAPSEADAMPASHGVAGA